MFKDSYTMGIEENITPIKLKGLVNDIPIPAEFRYHACPRCDGTVYSPPHIKSFYCLVCGWAQKCNQCFGEIGASGTGSNCKGCGQSFGGGFKENHSKYAL